MAEERIGKTLEEVTLDGFIYSIGDDGKVIFAYDRPVESDDPCYRFAVVDKALDSLLLDQGIFEGRVPLQRGTHVSVVETTYIDGQGVRRQAYAIAA